jgi:hypothetical protein
MYWAYSRWLVWVSTTFKVTTALSFAKAHTPEAISTGMAVYWIRYFRKRISLLIDETGARFSE